MPHAPSPTCSLSLFLSPGPLGPDTAVTRICLFVYVALGFAGASRTPGREA